LLELIGNKIAGEGVDIVSAPAADGRSNVIDLMAALQASLDITKTSVTTTTPKRKRNSKNEKDIVS
jgi:DNA end-binding protein Ku